MDILLMMDLVLCDCTALPVFQQMRDHCRRAVARQPEVGAALLFTGSRLLLMLEGPEAALEPLHGGLRAAAGTAGPLQVAQAGAGSTPALQAGRCRSGYLDGDTGQAEAPAWCAWPGVPDAPGLFLRLLQLSDHD